MVTFITEPCSSETVNFFTSAKYTRSSFSRSWATRTAPDTEGLGQPVYIQVLNKYNIPIDSSNGLPPGGTLPGIDILKMDAIAAIRLSLAEALIFGQWWDVYEDPYGGVKFQKVFDNGAPGKTVVLDIRLCIPAATKENQVDMVTIRGYNPPAERYARPFSEFPDVVPQGSGLVNPNSIDGTEKVFTVDLADSVSGLKTCHSAQLKTTCTKSFIDPLTDVTALGPQEKNPFYDFKAYENLIAYAIKVEGMPLDSDEAARVKYVFADSTDWYFRPQFPVFSPSSLQDVGGCDSSGVQSGQDIEFYKGSFNYVSPEYTDRYGTKWPLVIKPKEVLYVGYKIDNIIFYGNSTFIFAKPIAEFIKSNEGSNWVYEVEGINRYKINMYYTVPVATDVWEAVKIATDEDTAILKVVGGRGSGYLNSQTDANALPAFSGQKLGVLPAQGALGYVVTDFLMAVSLDRPSVTITDPQGEARKYSDSLRVRYAPIILYDPPAPIAYKHKDAGLVKLGPDELALDEVDNDPTTCQNFETTPLGIMQNLLADNALDLTLPFCENVDVCAKVASTIFDYQNYGLVQTYTLTCGPDDEPELGAAVDGFDSNLRIESINYSYQDESSYTIEVTLGPLFSHIGSFNDLSAAVPKTEEFSRKGIVTYTAGDGSNYRVRIQGFGEYNAINTTRMIWRLGEMVSVTIKNNPVEV